MVSMKYMLCSYAVSPAAEISTAIEQYRRHCISMSQLFSDYASVYLGAGPAVNCWAERQKEYGLPYERGATIAETLMLTAACPLKKCKPTDVIKALFYNQNNNDSAVECGILQPAFAKARKDKYSVVVNPSPDFLLLDFYVSYNTLYLVPDPLVAKLYRKQFDTERIMSFDEVSLLPPADMFLVMQRRYPAVEDLLAPLAFHSADTTAYLFLPHTEIEKAEGPFWKSVKGYSLYVEKATRLDTAVLSTPKKKTLLILKTSGTETVKLYDSKYDSLKKEIEIFGPVRKITSERFSRGGASMREMIDGPKTPKTNRTRKPALDYEFSNEIRLGFLEKTDKCGTKKIVMSYRAVPRDTKKQRGEKLIKDINRRIGKATEEAVLESIPFEPACWDIIAADIRNAYAEKWDQMSLKTCWFLCATRLKADREYNHERACKLFFKNNDLAQIKLCGASEDDIIKAVESVFKCGREDVEYAYWRQLDLIIRKMIQTGFANSNTLERYVYERSNRLTDSQREVRDAQVKKSLQPEEMRHIVEYLSAGVNGKRCYTEDSRYVAAWIKLLTGMTNAEICALKWNDYIQLDFGLGSQLSITKYMSSTGAIITYNAKEERKIRNVPNSKELQFILDAFYHHLCDVSGIPAKKLDKMPIVLSMKSLKNKDAELRPMSLNEMKRISKKLLEIAGIEPHKIIVHDGGNETELDLHMYKGDFFRENARYMFRQRCNMTEGEACYLIGKTRPSIVERNYIGFSHDLMQYRMLQMMRRGLAEYDQLIGLTDGSPTTDIGCTQLREKLRITSGKKHVPTVQVLFTNGCQKGNAIRIQAEHGLRWNCSFIKEETK